MKSIHLPWWEMRIHCWLCSDGWESGVPYLHVHNLDVALKKQPSNSVAVATLNTYSCKPLSLSTCLIYEAAVSSLEVLSYPAPAMRSLLCPSTDSSISTTTALEEICDILPGINTTNKTVVAVSRGLYFYPSWEKYSGIARCIFNDLHILWNESIYPPLPTLSPFPIFPIFNTCLAPKQTNL